jgi:hypothetical protein
LDKGVLIVSLKGLIFITVGQSEAATCGKCTHEILPERQNKDKSSAFQAVV